jgi:uncharacterized membrane protein
MEPGSPFANQDNGKIAGIVSYFSIIGWLIAYFALYQNNKTSLASYQLRQTLLFHIISMVLRFGLGVILTAVWFSTGMFSVYGFMRILYLGLFIIWIIGLIGAINGEKKEIPLIGDWAQNVFSSI